MGFVTDILGGLLSSGKSSGGATPAAQQYQPNAQVSAGISPIPYQKRANVFTNLDNPDGSQPQQSPVGGKTVQTVQPPWVSAAYSVQDVHKSMAKEDPLYGGAYYLANALFGGRRGNR